MQQFIEQMGQVQMPIRTVGEYLKRWGYTPQKRLERVYEQDPEVVEEWLKETYPQIEQRAQTEGTGADQLDCQHQSSRNRPIYALCEHVDRNSVFDLSQTTDC